MRHLSRAAHTEHALGGEDRAVRARTDDHLRACTVCAAEQAAILEALGGVAAAFPAAPDGATIRARLLSSVVRPGPYGLFADRVARLFDVGVEAAERLLAGIDDPVRWEPGPADGTHLCVVTGGARIQGALAGFVRATGKAIFPVHRHVGDEALLVLDGGFHDTCGLDFVRGNEMHMPAGSAHGWSAAPDGCLSAAVVLGGIELVS